MLTVSIFASSINHEGKDKAFASFIKEYKPIKKIQL